LVDNRILSVPHFSIFQSVEKKFFFSLACQLKEGRGQKAEGRGGACFSAVERRKSVAGAEGQLKVVKIYL
jgi:hypothetical protein